MIKKAFEIFFLLLALPFALPVMLSKGVDKDDRLFSLFSETVSLIPGFVGVFTRRAFYKLVLNSGAEGLTIGFCSTLAQRGISLGKNVYIGSHCSIGLSSIGSDVLIGSHVNIISGRHVHFFDDPNMEIRFQGGELKKIQIGDGCWIANNATVLESIGRGCVIGASANVIRETEPMGIYAGNPAKLIRLRGEKKIKS